MSLRATKIKARNYTDFTSPLLLALMALMGVGLVQVYSSSYVFATESYGDGLYFFKRQFIFTGIGLLTLLAAALVPLSLLKKWSFLLWIGAALGIGMTFIPGLGVRVGGAFRWIQLPGGIRFEPSEILKFSFALLFATLLTRSEHMLGKIKPGWLGLLVLLPLLVLLKQPDFGSFAIIVMSGIALLFCFGLAWKYIVGAFAVLLPSFYFLVMMKDYRRARVMTFLDPWSDPEQSGYQVIRSMMSFSSGGFTGVGLGQGQGKLFFLPEAHTDFTMAVLGEEVGFLGFLLILSLYGFVILRAFQIAYKCTDRFMKAFSLGLGITFALSVFINMGVVMGLLPTKGLTLPFLSYGGSSLFVLCLMFGFLLNIERHTDVTFEMSTDFQRIKK